MKIVGVDIGGTGIQCGIIDRNNSGKLLAVSSCPTPKTELSQAVAKLVKEVCQKSETSLSELLGVGVACPGWIDSQAGVVRSAANLPYENLPLAEELSTLLDGVPVKLDNDGNLAALGEYTFGAAKEYTSALVLMVGTGIGGAYVSDGKILDSELGHFTLVMNGKRCGCGMKGCAEIYASTSALLDTAREMGLTVSSGAELFEGIRAGDATAKAVLEAYIPYLAATIVSLANVYRPKIIVLGGGIIGSKELLFPPLLSKIEELIAPCCYKETIANVISTQLQGEIGILGAVALWMA